MIDQRPSMKFMASSSLTLKLIKSFISCSVSSLDLHRDTLRDFMRRNSRERDFIFFWSEPLI